MPFYINQSIFLHLYALLFFLISAKFGIEFKKSGNRISKHTFLGFLFVGVGYLILGLDTLLFSNNLVVIKIVGTIEWIPLFIAHIFALLSIYDIYPFIPIKKIVVSTVLFDVIMLAACVMQYKPAYISSSGVVNGADPTIVTIGTSLVFMVTLFALGFAFILKTIHTRSYIKGLVMGLGFILFIIFINLMFSTDDRDVYSFFATIGLVGLLLLFVGTFLPSKGMRETSQ